MIVLFWSRATRDLLKSFGWGIAALHRLHSARKLPSPRRPPHRISQQWLHRLRRRAEQDGQCVEALVQLDRQLRDSRFGLPENVCSLVNVELGRGAALKLGLRDR